MFINVKAYDSSGALIYEVNPFDAAAGTLKGLTLYTYSDPDATLPALPVPQALNAATEAHVDELVYEMHPKSSLTGEDETFHFALADGRYKDNRIPPKGYRIAEADARVSVPVWHGDPAPTYFTSAEYAGGYDEVSLTIASGAAAVDVTLNYQTTSREYMEFLRNEINGSGALTLEEPSPFTGLPAYRVQTDPFFSQLRAWGDTIWLLWKHNYQVGVAGAVPVVMAEASLGDVGTPCTAPAPTLLSTTPGNGSVTITWSDESADPMVAGYKVYHDQAGKSQLVATVSAATTSYTDSGLTNGQEVCYKVTSYYSAECESLFSNILCAIPNNQGQAPVGVTTVETGLYQTTGKGPNKTTTFVLTSTFTTGDGVVMRAYVIDTGTGLPVENAGVHFSITGPETNTFTANTDANGIAEATWNTSAANKRGHGGTAPGTYTVYVTDVSASGYPWDGVVKSATFMLQ
jgi:hypothetical protein